MVIKETGAGIVGGDEGAAWRVGEKGLGELTFQQQHWEHWCSVVFVVILMRRLI